jgi:chromosomal replication initiation ATPase DnaA
VPTAIPHPPTRQLALPFLHRIHPPADDLLAAPSNEAARHILQTVPAQWPNHRLALWGPPGCGKSHLLHLWVARQSDAALLAAAAISRLAQDGNLPAAALAIDDIDTASDEPALLHLLNIAAERQIPLVLATRISPARLAVALPDLASRLRATLAIPIEPPDDDLLDALLARHLARRQLAVGPEVIRFLRLRLPREADALRRAAARLDAASLERARPITVALAASLLPELARMGDPVDEPSHQAVSSSEPVLV